MKKTNLIKSVLFAGFIAATFASCGNAWLSDFDKAKEIAAKNNKEIMLLVSGDDMVEASKTLKETVTSTKEFINLYSKDYVLVNIDISQEEMSKAVAPEDADEKTKKEAEKISKIVEKKNDIGIIYSVQNLPSIYILSQEGWYLDYVPYDATVVDVQTFGESLSIHDENISTMKNLANAIRTSNGPDKLSAINAMYQATGPAYIASLREMYALYESLDPENTTGLLGFYDFVNATFAAFDNTISGDKPATAFINAINKGRMDDEYTQKSWFFAARATAETSDDFDAVLEYLDKAYNTDPNSDIGKFIPELTERLKKEYEASKQ